MLNEVIFEVNKYIHAKSHILQGQEKVSERRQIYKMFLNTLCPVDVLKENRIVKVAG